MSKKESLNKMSSIIDELRSFSFKNKTQNKECVDIIKKINKDIMFLQTHKLTDQIVLLILKEIENEVGLKVGLKFEN